MALTDRAIRNLKPLDKDKFYADGSGLYLRVKSTGSKVFLFRRQANGRSRWITLGHFPDLKLVDARQRALELSKSEVPGIITVKDAYETWFTRYVIRQYKRPDIVSTRFLADPGEAWFKRPIGSITRANVSDLLQTIVDRGSPAQANRLLPDLKHFFAYAVERGWLTSNPAEGITRKSVGGKEVPRDRVLTIEELGKFIPVLQGSTRLHLRTKLALGLVMLTGQRSSEVLSLKPSAIDDQHWWYLQTTKAGRPHKVYLTRPARALLHIATKYFGDNPFGNDHRALSHAVRRILPAVGIPHFTPHDLRRTMATRLADVGIAPYVVEKMLNHQMEGVMSIYNRSEYMIERKAAWEKWAEILTDVRRKKDQE